MSHCVLRTLLSLKVHVSKILMSCSTLCFLCNVKKYHHVKSITRTAFFHLRNIAKIRPMLSAADTETLIHTFILSSLQLVQKAYFKVLLLAYKTLHGLALSYLKDIIIPYCPSLPLRSSGAGFLSIPKLKKKSAGHRASLTKCPICLSATCNQEADSVDKFKSKHKTYLFTRSFGSWSVSQLSLQPNRPVSQH
ncbi:hypothetical protein N1851_024497 [Merluccius polli]|uniref:Secreted protein n=1 Tax=Merluccius polli TaxID=89951 RepID=A0AA47NWV5_MERPO|nr:hypothetical protein N1851_024497 [Merluccius polli]